MGKFGFVVAAVALFACGSDNKAPPDARKPDAAIDAKVFNDAAPDAPLSYDFSCFGVAPTTTAVDPVTVSGTTETLSQTFTLQAVPSVTVESFRIITSTTSTLIDTVTSNGTTGTFSTANLDPANTATAVSVFLKTTKTGYRTSYLYPPYPLTQAITMVPVLVLSIQSFALLTSSFAFNVTQDDTVNGVLLLAVTDCANTPIPAAVVKVQQGGTDAGTIKSAGDLFPQAAGTYFVFNVPDGATDVYATYMGMTFPTHTILSHKQPPGGNSVGTITATQVRPGY